MTYAPSHHQGAGKILWFHFWGALVLFIFTCLILGLGNNMLTGKKNTLFRQWCIQMLSPHGKVPPRVPSMQSCAGSHTSSKVDLGVPLNS